ncbi:ABC transporter ATP-binding protein [Lunatimonas salinarum]|uniref:ABC transporter ATP-binding protein n=1 Tax=Lunatimonas salinarum TaxID=1774590 RepID=UPI001AE09374|nr:ABC transporter ATP-binding protein [Lunatimonas salinarum]
MPPSPFKKYFTYFRFFYGFLKHRLIVAFALSIGVGLMDGLGLTMFIPLLQLIDGGEGSAEGLGRLAFLVDGLKALGIPFTLVPVLLIMVLFFLAKGAFKFMESYYRVRMRRYFIQRLRFQTIDRLSELSYKAFVLSDSGRIQNTVSGEMERVVAAWSSYRNVLQSGAMVFVYMLLALSVNVQFSLLVALGALAINAIYSKLYKRTKSLSRKVTNLNHLFQGFLIQQVAYFKYLKATGKQRAYGQKMKDKIVEIENSHHHMGFIGSAIEALREPMVVIIVVGVILLEVMVLGGTFSAIILSLLFFYRALTYLISFQSNWNSLLTMQGSLVNLMEFLEELKAGQDRDGKLPLSVFRQSIRFDGVSFAYQNLPVLRDIHLELPRNQTLALVGESGSGKTTLMNLIAGLALPDQGGIYVDGISVRDLNRATYQSRIGYITQEPVIFSDTVFNNVSFWDRNTPENRQRVQRALEKASVWNFVETLPQGMDAPLGSGGILVSGGQKQRISIARELYKDVDILLMDEATSALDSETERAIQDNIEALKGKYTIVMIAHRLSTVKHADRILVMQAGEIIHSGSFDELISHSGPFKKMVELQEF